MVEQSSLKKEIPKRGKGKKKKRRWKRNEKKRKMQSRSLLVFLK
jgi:hypothetical protein